MARAFTSRTIRQLARRAMDIVNEEQRHAIQFARLMSVFLGDDPTFLKVDRLNLPIYNHLDGITDPEEGPDNKINGIGAISSAVAAAAAPTTDEDVSTEQANEPTTTADSTATQSTNTQPAKPKNGPSVLKSKSGSQAAEYLNTDLEPFFGLPQIHIDRDYGIKTEDAEDARQLTQIAQQRSEEFIRCMVNVRQGLLRAERYQSKVYKWCREMAGDEDDSDGMEHVESKKDSDKS